MKDREKRAIPRLLSVKRGSAALYRLGRKEA